ncbi:hypothetical protein BKA90DRAFT_22155, partial [Yarrowia lipolytica]
MKISRITVLLATTSVVTASYSLTYAALINPIKDAISNGVVNGRHSDIPLTQAQSEISQFVPLIMNDDLLPVFDNAVGLVLNPKFPDLFPGWINDVIQALDDYEKSPDFVQATELLSKFRTHYDYHEAVNQASITLNSDAPGWGILKGAVLGISDKPGPSKAIVDGLYAVTGLICTLQLTDGSVCDPYKTEEPATSVATTPAPVETTPAPVETTPAPVDTTPAPVETTPAPVETTPAPVHTATYVLTNKGLINPIKDAISNGVVNGRHSDIPLTQAQSEISQFVPLIMNDDLLPIFDNAVALLLNPKFPDLFPGWISDVIQALDNYEHSPDFTLATELLSKFRTHYDYHEAVNQASITLSRDAIGWGIL